jgi:hypothetical protein
MDFLSVLDGRNLGDGVLKRRVPDEPRTRRTRVRGIASASCDKAVILEAVGDVADRKNGGENEEKDGVQYDRGDEEIQAWKHGHRNGDSKHWS